MTQTISMPQPERPFTLASDPAAARARELNNRGALLHLEGKLDEAGAEYEAALNEQPRNATAANNLGFLLAQQGRLEEAVARYRQALEIDPGKSMTFANLGVAQAALGQPAPA